ncbi:EAL domain-containing protein [Aestuariibacter sp. A3R04]|nr:EAL domain-containing protein [Aestuariibacter sp. A3R04]
MWVSLSVYEDLYENFVAKELQSLSTNLANDLLPFMNEPPGNFAMLSILLRLEEYDNVEFARVYNIQADLVSSYAGNAMLSDDSDIVHHDTMLDEVLSTLPFGLKVKNGHIQVVQQIGDPAFSQGKLVISYRIAESLSAGKRNFFVAVLPFVVALLILAVFIALELQRRSLRPLFNLITQMRQIEETQNYAVTVEIKGKTEIQALTQGFNRMMFDINKQTELNRQKNQLLTKQQEQMEQLANFDPLTGLPNRQFLMKTLSIELARAKRNESDVIVLFLDLDGFKVVNDSFGHDVGDKLLCRIADLISKTLREGDIVGRLGGDEFVVILSEAPNQAELENICQRLVDILGEPQNIEQWKLDTGVSVGVAMAKDCDYQLSILMSNADIAMYHAKRNGRGQFTLFTRMMQNDNKRIIHIASSITSAIDNDEFYLVYQPKVNHNSAIQGFEALLRWYNPYLGLVSPGEFIPIAEQSDKIAQITKWVVNQVCTDLPRIQKQYGGHVVVSLNLSASDLSDDSVTDFTLQRVAQLGDLAQFIEFEITESAYLKSFQSGNIFFEKARSLDCKIALDDFGTGYSSLSYLTEFNIDTLKIDRQFVSQIGISERSELITDTIINMAVHLKLEVCAEGVETEQQAAFLKKHGCHLLQGFYFGKPEPLNKEKTYPALQ